MERVRLEHLGFHHIEPIMHISWADLNSVQEAGDLPFRDGRITVTFAELAIWKKNPRALFRLMRKHPIQGEANYVLGQQVEGEGHHGTLFYKSSNGDTWSLISDHTTGAPAVVHAPNASSGGSLSHIDIESFLSNGAAGPEHQALRQLMEKNSSNATILIAYDIHPAQGAGFDDLIAAIQSLGAWWHHLETVWIVRSNQRADEIRDKLKSHIGEDDQLLILDITDDRAEWAGVSDAGSEWLKEYTAK
jgi:hypothetical protein